VTWAFLLLASFTPTLSSPHAEDLARHAGVAPFDFPPPAIVFHGATPAPRVKRVVYGYYPYWVSAWEQLRWDLLTHIAYFAVNVRSDGTIGDRNGWPDRDFVDTAHSHGVRAEVSFTLFSGSGIRTLCSSDTNRARGISNMIDEMEAGGADGINVDFEGLSRGTRDCFTRFIRELREGLDARGHLEAQVSIAAPAVDWTGEFDLAELSLYTDVFFIMGYGYHWTRSGKPGPVGQLRITESWRPHLSISMQRTIAHYTSLVPPERRSVIVFGVPYYGREWPTGSADMHSPTTGEGSSRTYSVARRAVEDGGRTRLFDRDSQNPWYVFSSGGGWRQTWYDDEESLAAKYELVLEQEIGGVGMWALGYDGTYPDLWDTLDAYFTEEPTGREGTRRTPIVLEPPFELTADTRDAPSNYFNDYACAPGTREYGREYVYAVELCAPGTLTLVVEDGAGVDVDLHVLAGDTEPTCIARDDRELALALESGRYLIVADSYVADHVPQEGPFTLSGTFTPDEPCRDPVLDPYVRVQTTRADPPRWDVDPRATEPASKDDEVVVLPEEGCGCTTSTDRGRAGWLVLLFVLGLAAGIVDVTWR
jgi:MYXO-CTERM domain-containing protein